MPERELHRHVHRQYAAEEVLGLFPTANPLPKAYQNFWRNLKWQVLVTKTAVRAVGLSRDLQFIKVDMLDLRTPDVVVELSTQRKPDLVVEAEDDKRWEFTLDEVDKAALSSAVRHYFRSRVTRDKQLAFQQEEVEPGTLRLTVRRRPPEPPPEDGPTAPTNFLPGFLT